MSADRKAQMFERVARGQEAERELEHVTAALEARKQRIIAEALDAVGRGTMDDRLALQLWTQLHEVKELEKALSRDVRLGRRAAEQLHGEKIQKGNASESQEFPYT